MPPLKHSSKTKGQFGLGLEDGSAEGLELGWDVVGLKDMEGLSEGEAAGEILG